MSSQIHLTRIPASEEFQILDVFIGGNGIADHKDLATLVLPDGMDWRRGVVINGKAPIWLYANLVHQCHPAVWVAVMDPRLGAVVIEAHHPDAPMVGSVIPFEKVQNHLPIHATEPRPAKSPVVQESRRIAFVGPPHSGKSVLLRAVYQALQSGLPVKEFQQDVFIIRACPDGEGNWFGEIPTERAVTLRHKSRWDDEFARLIGQHLEAVAKTKRLVLVDLGGKIDRYTQQILNRCTHAIIVSRDPDAVAEWRGAIQASEVKLLAEVESVLEDICQIEEASPLQLKIGRLERGREMESLPEPLVGAIANWKR